MASSQHDWKIVYRDVKPQSKQNKTKNKHFETVVQQLRSYFRYGFQQQQLWFQVVAVGVTLPSACFWINAFCGRDCCINPYSCLVMGPIYMELQCIVCWRKTIWVFSLVEQNHSHLVNLCNVSWWVIYFTYKVFNVIHCLSCKLPTS